MKIIKRNGTEVMFDISKITMAVSKANEVVDEKVRMTPVQIQRIAESVELACQELGRSAAVEEIQDMVEKQIMAHGAFEVLGLFHDASGPVAVPAASHGAGAGAALGGVGPAHIVRH